MSRCFTYPPPGYDESKASNYTLIESIKLWADSEKAKSERWKVREGVKKEKKREKKEKKKKEKELKPVRKQKKLTKDIRRKFKKYIDRYLGIAPKVDALKSKTPSREAHRSWRTDSKKIEEVIEQMKRSGITEEHEWPVNAQKISFSSASQGKSYKRKRLIIVGSSTYLNAHGNNVRIRLPSGKQEEPNSNKEFVRTILSTPLRSYSLVPVQPMTEKNPVCSTSGADQAVTPVDEHITKPSLITFEKEMEDVNVLYKELELLHLGDDRQGQKRHKPSSDLLCGDRPLQQPHAQLLQ